MITIALATERDIPQILDIEKEAFSPPWTHDALLDELCKEDSYFIVARDNTAKSQTDVFATLEPSPCLNCVLGYALVRQVGDDRELLKIAVEKTARGNGIGDLLMCAVLDHAEENMLKPIFLEVRVGNIAATRLYEKHGFKSVRIRKDYYNDPYEDAIIMVKGDMW